MTGDTYGAIYTLNGIVLDDEDIEMLTAELDKAGIRPSQWERSETWETVVCFADVDSASSAHSLARMARGIILPALADRYPILRRCESFACLLDEVGA